MTPRVTAVMSPAEFRAAKRAGTLPPTGAASVSRDELSRIEEQVLRVLAGSTVGALTLERLMVELPDLARGDLLYAVSGLLQRKLIRWSWVQGPAKGFYVPGGEV